MFDSGVKAVELIEQIKAEADIAIPIPDISYVMWLNSVEQLLYSELIREQGEITIANASEGVIDISSLTVPSDEEAVRFEDIHAIYADKAQLIKSTLASGVIFPNTYYKKNNNIGLNLSVKPEKLKIIYLVRPRLKAEDSIEAVNVCVPVEFTDLVKAKLRGEAYKLANEDSLAAKWINDYNTLLETFKMWIQSRQSDFGL